MSEEEIRAAYPDCADAVIYCEETIRQSSWLSAGADFKYDVGAVIADLADAAEDAFRVASTSGILNMNVWIRWCSSTPQLRTPGFRRYVAAKLGLM